MGPHLHLGSGKSAGWQNKVRKKTALGAGDQMALLACRFDHPAVDQHLDFHFLHAAALGVFYLAGKDQVVPLGRRGRVYFGDD